MTQRRQTRHRHIGTRPTPSSRHHHDWLELIETTGPFLTVPVLERVLPNGPGQVAPNVRARVRTLVAQMLDDHGASRHELVSAMLDEVLDWGPHGRHAVAIPDAMSELIVEHGQLVRPDFAFYAEHRDTDGGAEERAPLANADDDAEDDDTADDDASTLDASEGGPWRLLGMVGPWDTNPLARITTAGWTASPVERLAALLRARDVPIGLVTDGRWWTLVWAPRGGTVATGTWDASLFGEEPESLAAFVALLERARFLGVPPPDTLGALFQESLERQEEVTETLGRQVRAAVELLVGALDALDAESGRMLLAEVSDDDLYDGVVTFMMRLVFLLFAEERRLLPSDDATYIDAYSVGQLVDQLESRAALAGEASLEHRTAAWHRLLALSRAVHQGVAHEDLRLPAYGGALFDPDRFPWLEGRRAGEDPGAMPPRIDDRTVLRMLRAVQYVEVRGERRRLTFRALDVEQIGYVYEGLLELEARTSDDVVLLLARPANGKRPKNPAEVPLSDWVDASSSLEPKQLAAWLADRTGLSAGRAAAVLTAELDPLAETELHRACGGDDELAKQIAPLAGALRTDADGRPMLALPGSRYVAASIRRLATGTHYTPRSLAEDVSANALEPLVYRPGPLETADRAAWKLRPSSEILSLKVADIAMGSGAFLVAACRYLADRLLEAWDDEGRADATRAIGRRSGRSHASDTEVEAVLLDARRLVTEHCLYGVDVNPLAVEMAKLSLWLVTMDRERPFGFLDDRLRCGDSLLGVCDVAQLETLHIDPAAGRKLHEVSLFDIANRIRPLLQESADLHRRITAQPVTTVRDVEHKHRLLADAEALTTTLGGMADALTAEGLVAAGYRTADRRAAFVALSDRVETSIATRDESELRMRASADLQRGRPAAMSERRPLHWPLEFPEVFADAADPGFDAIIGNPPFLGGKKISGALGDDYRRWLQTWDGRGVRGSADLVAFFLLRAERLLSPRGQLGYLAVNTLVQGDTLEVGLLQATARGLVVRRGTSSHKWPSKSASLEIVDLWASRVPLGAEASSWLDGEEVPNIGPDLEPVGNVTGRPERLEENEGIAFIGSYVLGLGFALSHEEARELIARDARYADVIQPYVIGRDLNQRPDCSASRHIINFREWSLERCSDYPEALRIVEERVRPERLKKDRDKYPRMVDEWWKYWQNRAGLEEAIATLDHVLAISRVGNALVPVRVATGPVFSEATVVFALDDFASLALLSSSAHQTWAVRYTSTLETRIRYAPSDVFLTFPRPASTPTMSDLGKQLDGQRRDLMLARSWGLTTTYNHVHDPAEHDPDVVALRDVHTAIDRAVFDAYGWTDLDPEVGHYPTKIGIRWTVSPSVRFEILDRLLAENHRRAAAERGVSDSTSP